MALSQQIAKGVLRAGGPAVIVAAKYLADAPDDFGRLRSPSAPRVVSSTPERTQRTLDTDAVVWHQQPQHGHQRQQRQKNKHQQQYHQNYHQQYQQGFQYQKPIQYDQPDQDEGQQQHHHQQGHGSDYYQSKEQPSPRYRQQKAFDPVTHDLSLRRQEHRHQQLRLSQQLHQHRTQQSSYQSNYSQPNQQHSNQASYQQPNHPRPNHHPSSHQQPNHQQAIQRRNYQSSQRSQQAFPEPNSSSGRRLQVSSPELRAAVPQLATSSGARSSVSSSPVQSASPSSVVITPAGRLLQDFILGEEIGRGGFGRVYRAKNRFDLLDYATKVVVNVTDKSSYNEARILAKINHPHIVRYHCAWLEPLEGELRSLVMQKNGSEVSSASNTPVTPFSQSGSLSSSVSEVSFVPRHASFPSLSSLSSFSSSASCLASEKASLESMSSECSTLPSAILVLQMELLSSWTLADWIAIDRGPSWSHTVVVVFSQILEALDYIHSRGIVHRDVKPSNVFFVEAPSQTELPFVKLGDFGLSLELRSPKKSGRRLEVGSQNTAGVGTAIYASPEQNSGNSCDGKADMFALGIMLFECLAPRFNTMSERLVILQGLRKGDVPLSFVKQYPQVSDLVLSLLSSDPTHRPGARQVLSLPLFHLSSTTFFPHLDSYHIPVHHNLTIRRLEEDLRRRDATIAQLNEQLRSLQTA